MFQLPSSTSLMSMNFLTGGGVQRKWVEPILADTCLSNDCLSLYGSFHSIRRTGWLETKPESIALFYQCSLWSTECTLCRKEPMLKMLRCGWDFSTRKVRFDSARTTPFLTPVGQRGSGPGFAWLTCIQAGLRALTLEASPRRSFSTGRLRSRVCGETVIHP